MSDYTKIFHVYTTSENIPFYMLNRRIVFPEGLSSPIYDIKYINTNMPWTILSYQIYNTIDYWWILCSLNKNTLYYAKEGSTIRYVKPEYISEIINNLENT